MTATATPQTLRDFATASGINFLVSLPEWYFKDNRRELGVVPQNFNGVNAQGLYLLWQKPSDQWTDADLVLHDKTLRFALDNRMGTRMGQHLAWGNQAAVPSNSWLRSLTRDELIRALQTHIAQVVKRYQDINVWCVVNEPREGFWGEKFGQDISWIQEV